MKVKPLNPTLRENKRYLVYEIISVSEITDPKPVSDAIRSSLRGLYGDVGLGEAGLIFLNNKFNNKTQRGIVRVKNDYLNRLRASLNFIDTISGRKVILKSIGASGILKKASAYLN